MQIFTLLASAALLPALTLAQDPNPRIFSLDIYNDCTQTGGSLPMNPASHTLFYKDAGTPGHGRCFKQPSTFGSLFIESRAKEHPECTLTTYSSVNCTDGTQTHAPVSLSVGEAGCFLQTPSHPGGGYKTPSSKSFLFKC
ncbi:hypothetical protein BGZ60DRAFT_531125 [Tricladium varicosporioides]|nr:hypothetical protein BGZ60DRAFT_531125 [Hymenoscyphus varicosporioides]